MFEIWDGSSLTRPDPSVSRAPDSGDWSRIVRELQNTQAAILGPFAVEADEQIVRGQLVIVEDKLKLAEYKISGMAVSNGDPGDDILFIAMGPYRLTDWTHVVGTVNLQPGREYFSTGSGTMSVDPPTEGFVVRVGQAITNELFCLFPYVSVRL